MNYQKATALRTKRRRAWYAANCWRSLCEPPPDFLVAAQYPLLQRQLEEALRRPKPKGNKP